MKISRIIILLSLLALTSCGLFKGSNKNKGVSNSEKKSSTIKDDSLLLTEGDDLSGSEVLEESSDLLLSDKVGEVGHISSSLTGKIQNYKVEKNDTLMLIAFKLYGDYRKWKTISDLNANIGKDNLKAGMQLKVYQPEETFTWHPKGNPYLIKHGDTLGKISNSVYGTPKHWKFIWENNRPMIINPNLIFAGFTLFYLDLDKKDLAGLP